jgi:CBS-domain-containing membrane protein
MAKQVHGVHEKDSLDAVEAVLRRARVRRVPVLDGDGTLKGILSMNDLARHAHRSAGRRGDGPSSASIVQTMAAICEPQIPADAKGPAANGRAVQPTA